MYDIILPGWSELKLPIYIINSRYEYVLRGQEKRERKNHVFFRVLSVLFRGYHTGRQHDVLHQRWW